MDAQGFLNQTAKQRNLCRLIMELCYMGLLDLLEKAYSKFIDNAPIIMEKMNNAIERAEENRQKMEDKVNSYIPTYQHLTLKMLKDEFSRISNSNETDATIKKRAISTIISNRQSQIKDFICEYSLYQSSTLQLEHTNVTHGRANFCVSPNRFNQNLSDVEAEMRLIAIERVLSERNNYK